MTHCSRYYQKTTIITIAKRFLVPLCLMVIFGSFLASGQFIRQPNAWSGPHGERDNHVLGDFNGDGLTDLIRIQNDIAITSTTDAFVWLSNGTQFGGPTKWGSGFVAFYGESLGAVLGDFNGDGKTDVMNTTYNYKRSDGGLIREPRIRVWLSSGTGFGQPGEWSYVAVYVPIVGDFDGDGRSDVANADGNTVKVLLSTGSSFLDAGIWARGNGRFMKAFDIDGDGRDDLVEMQPQGPNVWIWFSRQGRFERVGPFDMESTSPKFFGDFNGDGLEDVLVVKNRNAFVRLGQANGLGALIEWGHDLAERDLRVGDFNGDGMADLVEFRGGWNSASALVWLSTGTKLTGPLKWAGGLRNWGKLGDFNGDGKTDFAQWQVYHSYVWLAQ